MLVQVEKELMHYLNYNMEIKEIINKEGKYHILFMELYGGGREKQFYEAIAKHLFPEYIERKIISSGWHSSHHEIIFGKNNINAKVIFDEYDCITLESTDTNCTNDMLKSWAEQLCKALNKD